MIEELSYILHLHINVNTPITKPASMVNVIN